MIKDQFYLIPIKAWLKRRKEAMKWANLDNLELLFALFYSSSVDYYLQNRSKFDLAIVYDDLIHNTREETIKFLKVNTNN
jgi:hypothetical protein